MVLVAAVVLLGGGLTGLGRRCVRRGPPFVRGLSFTCHPECMHALLRARSLKGALRDARSKFKEKRDVDGYEN